MTEHQKHSVSTDQIVDEKLAAAAEKGCVVSFDPEEAELAGAFEDDAIDEEMADGGMMDDEG